MLNRIAILGPGLLGGSLALALKARVKSHVSMWARRPDVVKKVRAQGCADNASTDLGEVVSGADTVVFATPVGVMADLARRIVPYLGKGTLVTDVGSVKAPVCAELGPIFAGSPAHFIGSHPMAGSEQTGLEAARPDLFDGAVCIVTPNETAASEDVERATALWQAVGGHVRILPPEEHDAIVATISHLPHLLAAVLVNTVSDVRPAAFDFCGPGFRDTTRIASGPTQMWTEILGENRVAVKAALDALIEKLRAASTVLASGSSERDPSMNQLLTQAKAQRDRLRLPKILSDA
ncbi:MAG TPA: prephenate dehydrogenase/arogenate dehydrogenase family protein [Chthoniobacteraceae bacterium]|nr:prephenate dehydrogenase/arogenate dehydrogenase family protein [Chthoniobacteraceae bacterium]